MKNTVWNTKSLRYSKEMKYSDFITERKDAVITRFDSPINEGAQPGWSFKNLLTKDVGSDIYLAYITLPFNNGHGYHAHSGSEIIYVLEGKLRSTYYSVKGEAVTNVLEPGDCIYAPEGTPHSVWNVGEKECRFIVVKNPPYFLEDIPLPPELNKKNLNP